MDARAARSLLLIQAFEQAPTQRADDRWSPADAAWATAEARRIEGGTAAADRLLMRRGELATRRLIERSPTLGRVLDGVVLPRGALFVATAAALVIGLALDGFGAQARINILALPLLGLLMWNLAVYALLAVNAARTSTTANGKQHGLRAALAQAIASMAARLAGADRRLPALASFGLAWSDAARPLHVARAAATLHALAAAIALGLVAGLYLRGLAFEYRAGWESTFLDANGVHALVSALLGPAAALIGDPLPSAAQLAALRFPASAGENAAPWIHRIALTIELVVVLPRLLLAACARRRARQFERALTIDLHTPYFQRLLRELSGASVVLHVQPYDHRTAADKTPALGRWLEDALGGAVRIELAAPAAYGDEPRTETAGPRLVLFAAGSTPEAEVHSDYLRRHAGRVSAALIDETELRHRLAGPDAGARLDQRRQAWRSMLDAAGIAAVFVDLDAAPLPEQARTLAAALRHDERTTA